MLYGLLAALGWGTADLTAAVCGRRIGSTRTTAIAQVASLLALVVAGAAFGEAFAAPATGIAVMLLNGLLAAAAYVTLYRALELGPVALVSPIVAAYAGISVILAVVLGGESLEPMLALGTALTLGGAVLTSGDIRQIRAGKRFLDAGVPWALASMLLFGLATYILGYWSQRVGWYSSSLLSRVGNVAGVLVFAWIVRRQAVPGALTAPRFLLAAFVGLADIVGVIAYARGAELGLISVVTAASAAFILIPVFGGLALFHERPALSQWVGVAGVFAGLVMLGLGA